VVFFSIFLFSSFVASLFLFRAFRRLREGVFLFFSFLFLHELDEDSTRVSDASGSGDAHGTISRSGLCVLHCLGTGHGRALTRLLGCICHSARWMAAVEFIASFSLSYLPSYFSGLAGLPFSTRSCHNIGREGGCTAVIMRDRQFWWAIWHEGFVGMARGMAKGQG